MVWVNGAMQNFSGSIDDSGKIWITTDFTNNTGATAGGNGFYYIDGNYSNSGTFIRQKGTVVMEGSSAQTMGGTSITTFNNLTFTGGGSKTLNQKEIIDGVGDFTNGVCFTTQTNVLNFTVNGSWINGSSSSYVSGPCEKDFNTAVEFRYPVGKAGRFNTCGIATQSSSPTTYRTEYFYQPYVNTTSVTPPVKTVSKVQYWYCDLLSGTAQARVHLYWIPGDYTSSSYMSTPSNIHVGRFDQSGSWMDEGQTVIVGNYNQGNVESDDQTNAEFGTPNRPYTLCSVSDDNSLPVELNGFNAVQQGADVDLNWNTYSELQNLGFEIERSNAAHPASVVRTFLRDTALLAKSPWGANYQTFDAPLVSDLYTYTLFQVDQNGIRRRLTSRTVDYVHSEQQIFSAAIYPNPAVNASQIRIQLPQESDIALSLYDVTGRLVKNLYDGHASVGTMRVPIDVSSLTSGLYQITGMAGDRKVDLRLVVRK